MPEKENLSALFDGEHLDNALIEKLGKDPSWQDDWRSFALTRDVLRGDTSHSSSWDIAARVALALEKEPAHGAFCVQDEGLQHAPLQNEIQASQTQLTQAQPTPKEAKRSMPLWLHSFTQVGMAASVALAVIVGVQQYNGGDNTASFGVSQPPVLQTIPLSGSAEPVSYNRTPEKDMPDESRIMDQRRRINAMFQDFDLQLRLNADDIANKPRMSSHVSEPHK